jgi:predicted RNA polymerase sigma factor
MAGDRDSDNPGAWLMAAAKRRAIDGLRRDKMLRAQARGDRPGRREASDAGIAAIEAAMDDDLGDELLGLIFTACHPVLSAEARAALTLRLIGGLTTDEIARAFLRANA